jgi:arylsulfatase A-like enzyme
MMLMRGPGGFTGGKVVDAPVSHLDVYPTLCELAGVEPPDWLQGASLMPLVHGEVDRLHEAIFAETTYHAAYQPHRAVRTERLKYIRRFDEYEHPVLANCDDSESKDLLVAAGWGDVVVPEEQLYDLVLDPQEGNNLAADPARSSDLAEMRGRLDSWMRETDDPLLQGPVEPPPGALVNEQWQVSPEEPLRTVTADPTAAPSS